MHLTPRTTDPNLLEVSGTDWRQPTGWGDLEYLRRGYRSASTLPIADRIASETFVRRSVSRCPSGLDALENMDRRSGAWQ
jgi:hypothetical protein